MNRLTSLTFTALLLAPLAARMDFQGLEKKTATGLL
jgi:hypothetical protein